MLYYIHIMQGVMCFRFLIAGAWSCKRQEESATEGGNGAWSHKLCCCTLDEDDCSNTIWHPSDIAVHSHVSEIAAGSKGDHQEASQHACCYATCT